MLKFTPEEIDYQGLDIYLTSGEYKGGFALQATWDASAVQFVDSDIYLSNPEILVKYSRIYL